MNSGRPYFMVQWRQHVHDEIARACGANIIKYTLETSVAENVIFSNYIRLWPPDIGLSFYEAL
jgi:hypothetical protein